jgi:V8-like Glu-specific endopeptidase
MTTTKIEKPMTIDEVKKLKSSKAKKPLVSERAINDSEMELIDGLYYPKGTKAIAVPSGVKGLNKNMTTDHFCPEHLDVDYTPHLESKKNRKPKFIDRDTFMVQPGSKTIFGPDQRVVYNSTAYPWGCVGRVETALGVGSGAMVGPRHLLTCCHIIDFRVDGTTGWIKFTPMYYSGSAPFGSANGIKTYYKYKVAGPTLDATESQYDYSVVVLDKTIGTSTGWMGTKAYSDSWDGSAVWTHAGYPMDLTGAQRPIYQTGIALDGDSSLPDTHESMNHQGDVWPGQSGGPFWGYWSGTPYVVATQSGQTATSNSASGGSDLLDLVNKARAEFP